MTLLFIFIYINNIHDPFTADVFLDDQKGDHDRKKSSKKGKFRKRKKIFAILKDENEQQFIKTRIQNDSLSWNRIEESALNRTSDDPRCNSHLFNFNSIANFHSLVLFLLLKLLPLLMWL